MHHQRVMIWVHIVTINWFLLWKGVIYGELDGYSIDIKDYKVTVQEGLCVTIPCTFTADKRRTFTNSSGIWRDSSDRNVAINKKSIKGTKPNFQLMGNPDIGDCTLIITDARREDAGSYYFRFEENKTSPAKYSYKDKVLAVTVTDLKDKPQIIINGELIALKTANLICVPPRNCPGKPPSFQWMKSDHTGIWRSSANVTFTTSKSDWQTSVTCTVTFQPGNKVTSNPKKLKVHYPPSVTVTTAENDVVHGSVNVSGREPVTLICRADSYPEADVTWYERNNIVNKSKSAATLHIGIASDTAYVCSAWNELGTDLKHVDLFVKDLKDKPQIIINGELIAGKVADLICVPPGHCTGTSPNFQWMKSDHTGIWRSSANVKFTPLKSDHQTSVTCTVTFQTGNKVSSNPKSLEVNVHYPPSVTVTTAGNDIVHGSVNVSGREPVTLICRADSYPEADVTWYEGNNIVNQSKSAATLHIDIASDTAFVCSAWNDQGTNLKHVNFFVKGSRCMDDKVIVGIVFSNIIILLLVALGVLYFIKRHMEKRRKGSEGKAHELCDAKGFESVYQNCPRLGPRSR